MTPLASRVRRGVADDLSRLIELDQIAAGGDGERIRMIGLAIDRGRCLVLSTDRCVVGYVISAPRGFFGRDFVELLMVDSVYRRTGVGRTLLQAAASQAATSRVFTSTNRSNAAMLDLLEGEHWNYSGQLEGLDDDDPELVYYIDV